MAIHVEKTPTSRFRLPSPFGKSSQMVKDKAPMIAGVLVESTVVRPEQFLVAAMAEVNALEIQYGDELDAGSVVRSVFNCATLGLLLGATLGHAYLVPYRKKGSDKRFVNLIPGYRGLIELAFRSGFLKDIDTEIVLEGETFRSRMTESGRKLRHDLPVERIADKGGKNLVAAYCLYHTRQGGGGITVVTRQEIDAVKNASSDTWRFSYPAMARKTAVRRASRNWSLSEQLAAAVHIDEQAERGEDQMLLVEGTAAEPVSTVPQSLPGPEKPATEPVPITELEAQLRRADGVLSDSLLASLLCAFMDGQTPEPEFHALRLQYFPQSDPRCSVINSIAESLDRKAINTATQDINAINQSGILSPELFRQLMRYSRNRQGQVK